MIGIENGFLHKPYSTCNSSKTEYIPFRLHIQRRGYKLHGFISISIPFHKSNNPSLGADGSKMFELSNPLYVRRLSMPLLMFCSCLISGFTLTAVICKYSYCVTLSTLVQFIVLHYSHLSSGHIDQMAYRIAGKF